MFDTIHHPLTSSIHRFARDYKNQESEDQDYTDFSFFYHVDTSDKEEYPGIRELFEVGLTEHILSHQSSSTC